MFFIQLDEAFAASLLDVLGETHVHALENYIEPTVIVFYPLGLHHVRAVRPLVLVEPLQYLDFSLLEGLLFCWIFILKLFNGIKLAIFDVSALVNMAKTPRANKLSNFVLSPEYSFGPFRRQIVHLFLHVLFYFGVVVGLPHWRAFIQVSVV